MEDTKYISLIKKEEEEEEEEGEVYMPSKILHPQVVAVTGAPPSGVNVPDEPEATLPPGELPVIQEIIDTLPLLDILRISAVLEDTLDQLSILNYIMPVPFERKTDSTRKSSKEMNVVIQRLERLQTCILKQRKSGSVAESGGSKLIHQVLPEKHEDKMEDFISKRPVRQTVLTLENLGKVQIDRDYASKILKETVNEMQELGTFTSLLKALDKEKEKKANFCKAIAREENMKKQIKSLQKELQDIKNQRQVEAQGQNEYIANLKDQLQELKAKTNMESRYVKKNTDLQIAQTQKKCNKNEEVLLEEIDKLEEKLEYWMEKYDKDTEMKQNELNSLKSAKASDLATLQDLAKQLREFEQVIIEDRLEKEKARKKIDQDALELKSIIKLQAWWRGTMVRRELGNFKMPKKEKDNGKGAKGKGKKQRQKRR
ncbi:dynein regulatory complex protein 9 isoform X2 [Phascolarctos cinereus]|uniref:Dynein regulatory complex protein 9 n=1 Tax=Phascolarctos cinereus TaxID=38626 RepID=A0A6P5K867_PHACI|nr:IQ domain-containing protein G isoform X2 [Phascolarctos cinereus]